MIHYQIRCDGGHEFDGWFKDSQAFDRQAKRGLIECPVCGEVSVTRALMAPALPRPHADTPPPGMPHGTSAGTSPGPAAAMAGKPGPGAAAAGKPPMAVAGKAMPDQLRALLQRMRAEVETNCEYVGAGFTEEARRIHRGEGERRGIYGEASPEQAEALSEEGIQVARIPWVDRADG